MKEVNARSLMRITASVLLVLIFGTFVFTYNAASVLAAASLPDVSINSVTFTTQTETINYSYKVEESYQISSFPNYYNTNSSYGDEAEAAATAANLMAYYGKRYSNLIDFTPGTGSGSNYVFSEMRSDTSAKQALIDSLYDYMNLSSSTPTISSLRSSMTSYVSNRGYMLGSYSVLANGSIDYSKIKRSTDNGYPTMLSLNGSNYVTLFDNGTSLTFTRKCFTGYHMCMVYGYKKLDFYNSNDELISSKLILVVSFGNKSDILLQKNCIMIDNVTVCAANTYLVWED